MHAGELVEHLVAGRRPPADATPRPSTPCHCGRKRGQPLGGDRLDARAGRWPGSPAGSGAARRRRTTPVRCRQGGRRRRRCRPEVARRSRVVGTTAGPSPRAASGIGGREGTVRPGVSRDEVADRVGRPVRRRRRRRPAATESRVHREAERGPRPRPTAGPRAVGARRPAGSRRARSPRRAGRRVRAGRRRTVAREPGARRRRPRHLAGVARRSASRPCRSTRVIASGSSSSRSSACPSSSASSVVSTDRAAARRSASGASPS